MLIFPMFLLGSATSSPVNRFNFLFLLRLRYANQTSTLAELIVAQHENIGRVDIEYIETVLKGKTDHRVLLIMDGYDEYKPGTNRDIDRAIESSIGNCFLILTSRPDLPSKEGQYVSKEIRDRMDAEVMIQGFTEESIRKCSAQYLESKEQSDIMLQQASNAGIDGLFKVPIILPMVCVLFYEHASLPETRTKIVQQIFELSINRAILKQPELKLLLDDLLLSLGELSWKALQSDFQQLLLPKAIPKFCSVEIEYKISNNFNFIFSLTFYQRLSLLLLQDELDMKSPLILKLGLLFETGIDTASTKNQPTFLSFQHKIFQEYSGAYFVSKRLQCSLDIRVKFNIVFFALRNKAWIYEVDFM